MLPGVALPMDALEGDMQESTKKDYADFVYAEFYPDKDKLMQLVLDTFYTKQDK